MAIQDIKTDTVFGNAKYETDFTYCFNDKDITDIQFHQYKSSEYLFIIYQLLSLSIFYYW